MLAFGINYRMPQTTERRYCTHTVSRLTGVSERQLQWWDEMGIVSPSIVESRRKYTADDIARVERVRDLRKAGVRLMSQIKQCLLLQYGSIRQLTEPSVVNDVLVIPKVKGVK